MQAVTHKLNLRADDRSRIYLNIDTFSSRVQEFCIASRKDLNVLLGIQHRSMGLRDYASKIALIPLKLYVSTHEVRYLYKPALRALFEHTDHRIRIAIK